jgi:glutaredoxin
MTRPSHLLCCLTAAFAAGAAMPVAAQYKWIDASWRVGYGDSAPRDARNVQRVDVVPADSSNAAVAGFPFELARAAQRHPVTLYTTRDCGPCAAARTTLQARGVPYSEMTVNSAEDFEAFRKLGGTRQFPVLRVGSDMLAGLDAERWNDQIDAAGYPRNQLPAGWKAPGPRALYEPPPPPPPSPAPYVPLGLGPSN